MDGKRQQAASLTTRTLDTAGNTTAGASHSYTLDTTVPTVSTPDLIAADDTGTSSTDNLTLKTLPTLTGTAEAGTTVTIFDGAASLGTATLTGTNWTFTVLVALSDGAHSFSAKATDTAGNATTSATLTVTVDTVAPVVSTPDLATADDTGISSTDNITTQKRPTFTGTATAGSTVTVFDGATLLGTATLAGTNWTYTVPNPKALSDGGHSITAVASDTAGNSTTTVVLTVTVDTVSPTISGGLDRTKAVTGWFNIATGAPIFS